MGSDCKVFDAAVASSWDIKAALRSENDLYLHTADSTIYCQITTDEHCIAKV